MNTDTYLRLQENLTNLYVQKLLTDVPVTERFVTDIGFAEQLGKGKMTLPLKVKGVFLTEGKPLKKYYPAKELELASGDSKNQQFKIVYDHRDKEAGAIVGMVDRIEYDSLIKGIRWWGHVNDSTAARNVLDGLITQVSVNVLSSRDYLSGVGIVGRDLEFVELSLVTEGSEPNNSLKLDKGD